MADRAPLILTLTLDPQASALFEAQRRRWFPPARNFIPAHVTLFHHLPGEKLTQIMATLTRHCADQAVAPFSVSGLRFLGRGVAYMLESPQATAFRARLAATWQADLTAQDKQPWRPHVTIQNKTDPAEARALHTALSQDFAPFTGTATGVHLWHYLGGPWRSEAAFPFSALPG